MSQTPIHAKAISTAPPQLTLVRQEPLTIPNQLSTYAVVDSVSEADVSSTHIDALSTMFPKMGKKRKLSKNEVHVPLGPSQTPKWAKQPLLSQITVVQQLAPQGLFSTSVTVPTFGALSFLVNSLDNFASLAAVYDQYRIDEIQVLISGDTQSASALSTDSHLMSVVDVDDVTVPTTLSQLGGYSSCISSPGTQYHFHSWKPQFAIAAYSGVFTSFASSSGWVDCASGTVQHYGLKYGSTSTTSVIAYSADIRYKVSFRSLH